MEIRVKSKYLKSSPQKVRPSLYGLRGQNVEKARIHLAFINRKGAGLALDVLKAAIAAGKEADLEPSQLFIKSVCCNEGPRLKRRQIKARGRADAITKRMCHIEMVLSDEMIAPKMDHEKNEPRKKENKKEITNSKAAKQLDSKTVATDLLTTVN